MSVPYDPDTAVQSGEDETAIVPDVAPTQAAELAWSEAVDDGGAGSDEPSRAGSVTRYALAGLLVLVTAGAVAVTGILLIDRLKQRTPRPTTTVTASAPVDPAAGLATPPAISTGSTARTISPSIDSDQDLIYLRLLAETGVVSGTKDAAIYIGHDICHKLDGGQSAKSVMWEVMDVPKGVSHAAASGVVGAAITAYCPQYSNQPRF